MPQTLFQINHKNLSLAEEYRYLISLPILSEDEADHMVEILEITNKDESLNYLIEEIEMSDYKNQGLQNLLRVISENKYENKYE